MRIPFFISALCLVIALVSGVARADSNEECSLDFKSLLQWRMRVLIIGQESKYKTDCMIEIKRREIGKPSLTPKCQRLLYEGSSVEKDRNLRESFDGRGNFFGKIEKEKLSDSHYRIVDATLSEARAKCNDKPLTPQN